MLIRAKYQDSKLITTHAERIDGVAKYCHDLAKDPSNGFTKDRTMRRIGSPTMASLVAYDQEVDNDFLRKALSPATNEEKNKAWRSFFSSDYGRPFLMVEKILH